MALKPVNSGLRRFVNDSHDIVRVDLRVLPGAELEVDDDHAVQLPAAIKPSEYVSKRDKQRAAAAKAAATPVDPPAEADEADES